MGVGEARGLSRNFLVVADFDLARYLSEKKTLPFVDSGRREVSVA